MKKFRKIASVLLTILMIMQISTVSYAQNVKAPSNVHWATEDDAWITSDTELVFELLDGVLIYKITLYKDGKEVYSSVQELESSTPEWYEDLWEEIEKNGYGSYTATVSVAPGELMDYFEEYDDDNDIPMVATSKMSDAFVYTKDYVHNQPGNTTKKPNTSANEPTSTTGNKPMTTTPSFENSIPGVNTVNITDIYNNELFEIVDEQEGNQNATQEYKELIAISEKNIHETDLFYYSNGLIYKKRSGKSFAGYYDIDGNLLQIGNIIPQSHFDGYCPLSNKLVANGFYDYVNKIAYQLPVNLEMALHMNKIYDVTQTKKINQEASKVYYDYTVNKVYTIKFKKYPIITVKYNNGVINFDQLPIIENGRTLVPLRAIFEKIGADVEWDGDTQTVTATKGDISISLTINSTTAIKNGQNITLDVPAKIVSGRTLVPVRFVSDCFGVNVEWDGATQTVILTTK